MFLVELVMQGVRGFRELARLRFQRGFNLVIAGNEAGKTTAADSIRRLLFPNNQAEVLKAFVSRRAPDSARGALVLCADDGVYYRIIQDFSKRAVNLSVYTAASKEFSLLHKDWENAVRFMAGQTSGVSEEDCARIFFYQREGDAATAGGSAPSASTPLAAQAAPSPSFAGSKAETERKKLAELREKLRLAEAAADAEYRYQSAKLALEELGKKMSTVDELERKKAELDASLEALKGCADLPENLSELIDDHERRLGQNLAETDERRQQLEGLKRQHAEMPKPNLFADKLFLSGGALCVLSVIIPGSGVLTGDLAYYLMAGGLFLSFMLVIGAWYNSTQMKVRSNNVLREMEGLENELSEIDKRFQEEGAALTASLQSAGASSAGELKEKADNYRYFLSLREELEEQRRRVSDEPELEVLRRQYEQKQEEIQELEKAAQAAAPDNVDTYSLRQDIERLESGASAPAAETSWAFSAEAQEPPFVFTAPVEAGGDNVFRAELDIASRAGGIELETLLPAVEAAAQRNLAAVTGGRYVRFEAGQEGGPIVHAHDDSLVNYGDLSHGTRRLVYFCFRTGLVEALAGKRRIPFILDDPLSAFDPARQKAACQVLRALGAKTQVVLFTSNPALKAEGDSVAELK